MLNRSKVGKKSKIKYNGTCVYAVQVLNFNNGYNFQSMAYTQCYAAKRTVKYYEKETTIFNR